jgi:hypothetical protein
VLSDEVRLHHGFFRWPEREVTTEDIERMERLEARSAATMRRDGGQAALGQVSR